MVLQQQKKNMQKSGGLPQGVNMVSSVSGPGLLETDVSYISGMRSGLSNEGMMMQQYN